MKLGLILVALGFQLSSYHFAHLFKQPTGVSLHQYHIHSRTQEVEGFQLLNFGSPIHSLCKFNAY
jgi:methylphosphotriester-DNA--protein-cysteine methyltransferase